MLAPFREHLIRQRQAGRTFDQRGLMRELLAFYNPELTEAELDAEVEAALADGAAMRRAVMD